MKIKDNIALILGISIPILMILFVAGAIYLPAMFGGKAQYDFVYVTNDEYPGRYSYTVEDGTVMRYENDIQPLGFKPLPNQTTNNSLYYYDVKNNSSRELSYEEARGLRLDKNLESKDGYKVGNGSGSTGFFLFDGGYNYNNVYLTGHNLRKKLNIQTSTYYGGFRFLGWVEK